MPSPRGGGRLSPFFLFSRRENFRKEIVKFAGYYKEYRTLRGEVTYEAESISFASMSQEDFEDLYQRFLDAVEEIFKFDSELLKENIEEFY